LELHTDEPEQLVHFYEEALGVKFRATEYPFQRYYAKVGNFGLIIGNSKGRDADTASEPGKFTLNLLSSDEIPPEKLRYFLHHSRPLGGAVPDRLAWRFQDPEGNYIALAPSMENVLGIWPRFSSLREMLDASREFFLLWLVHAGKKMRRKVAELRDSAEKIINHVSVIDRDLRGYTHVIASRPGLFVANATSYKQVLRGRFFGITVKDGDIYCFQAMGEHGDDIDANGRIIRLCVKNDRIEKAEIVVTGIDSACHQIDFVGDDLLVVDCYNGRILQVRPGSKESPKAHYPLGEVSRATAREQYHMNSIAGHPDGTIWVLLHNGGRKCSEIVVLDKQFKPVRRIYVDAGAAHNIVFTNDELEYLVADSLGGRIISAHGTAIDGGTSMLMVRGISLDDEVCVIGDSAFSTRPLRRYVPGRVHFVDRRTWSVKNTIALPGAPTDIRKIDGKDLSITNYVATQPRAPRKDVMSVDEYGLPSSAYEEQISPILT